ncbi:MAG: insulinase family protein [Bacteroidota bacterium]
MKNIILIIAYLIICVDASAQKPVSQPIDVEVYQLGNGMTVILNEDHNQPKVFGGVIVRAGGKDDPEGATGMAHYQEHMLFKGTEELGTTDWASEKPHIDNIFRLYDKLAGTTDPVQRAEIQNQINEESLKANEFAIPNELSNLIKSIGGTGLNAGTGPDNTLFYNSFPPTQIEKWLDLYSHRFEKPVFRSFQAELEVVYEEKNMYSDVFVYPLLENFNKHFFKNHPYGQQTLIGTIEDLKNPSLSKMYDFFKTWYVPNNMALIISGDFDTKLIKPLIEEKFGKWVRKDLPERITYAEKPFNGREFIQKKLSPIKLAILGFRTPPAGHPDEIAIQICNALLSNESKTGLLDKLSLDNKLMDAQVLNMPYNDHGANLVLLIPKLIGQKLGSAEKLVMAEITKLKTGDFDTNMINNIKLQLYTDYQLKMESIENKSQMFAYAFGRNQSIPELLSYPDKLLVVTKADVLYAANKYFGDNYLAFYSKMGFPKKQKIDKPEYKPLPANKSAESTYALKFKNIRETIREPDFFDFGKDIDHIALNDGMDIYRVKNPVNNIFTLKMKFRVGYEHNPDLEYATEIMNYASPEGMSSEQFKTAMSSLGCRYTISGSESYTEVTLTGLESNLKEAINLTAKLISMPVAEQSKVEILYDGHRAERKIERSEPDNVAEALFSYVRYGVKSEFIDRLSLAEIKSLKATELCDAFKSVMKYCVEIHFAGVTDAGEIATICAGALGKTGGERVETPFVRDLNQYSENTVYFIPKKKATQSKVYFFVNGFPVSPDALAGLNAFNMYFGGDFSGLVLQEIRESRSLAYTAGARFSTPVLKGKESYFAGYVGTQADKTIEAMTVFDTLIRFMPIKSERTKMIQQYLMQSSLSERPSFRKLSEALTGWKNMGFENDPAQYYREAYEKLSFDNIEGFYKNHLQGKPVVICIVGDKNRIDTDKLSKFGKLVYLKESSLFSK